MKKYISLILLFIFVLCISPTGFTDSVPEVTGSEAKLLSELGIFAVNDFKSTEEKPFVTRSDAAKLFVKMTGMIPSDYEDVPLEDLMADSNASYISAAYKLGFISGTSDVTYEPDGLITISQSAKIIMNILGYGDVCEALGGYPSGYLMQANRIGIFDGVNTSNENITYDQMSIIVLNAMHTEIAVINSIGETTEYSTYENTNLLSENFDIYIAENTVITSDTYTNLYGYTATGDKTVVAGLEVYDASGFKGEIPLGSCCDIYYRKNGSKKELLWVMVSEESGKEYNILSKQIASASETLVEYEDEAGKLKKIKLASNACVVYNGQFASYSEGMFENSDELILKDNNGDSVMDVVFVNKYTILVADTVSASNYSVSDKLSGKTYTFEAEGNNYSTLFYYGDEKTNIYEIEKDSVLSVLIPLKTDVEFAYRVYITDDIINGSVETVDIVDKKITIDGKEYDVTEELISGISPGDSGSFLVDKFSRIVSRTIRKNHLYAYAAGVKKGTFGQLTLKMFGLNGTWFEADVTDNVDFNSNKISKELLVGKTELFATPAELNPQLVRYTLNSKGEINSINTASDYTSLRYTDEEISAADAGEFRLSYSSKSSKFYKSGIASVFSPDTHMGEDTVIIYVPSDTADYKAYEVASVADLNHESLYTNIKAYNCSVSGEAQIVVLNDTLTGGSTLMLVSGITKSINATGDEVHCIKGFSFGYGVSFNTESNDTISKMLSGSELKKGDVIVVRFNSNDEIKTFKRVYENGVTPVGGITSSNFFNAEANVCGTVIGYDNLRISLDTGALKASFMINSAPVYVFESENGRDLSRVGSLSDIEKGDRVFLDLNHMKCDNIIVYK